MRSLCLAALAIGFIASSALAETPGAYVTAETGLFLPSTLNAESFAVGRSEIPGTGKSVGAAYGYDFGNGFRTEIEGLTSRAASERFGENPASPKLTASSVTLKGLYEFRDGTWHMKPYLGAGIGLLDLNAPILGAGNKDGFSAYQLRGGVALGFTQKLIGSLEYRWAMGSKPNFLLAGVPTKLEVDRHGFVVGVNYKY